MTFDPEIPYDSLPPLPQKADIETPAVWKACNAATLSLARLSEALHLIDAGIGNRQTAMKYLKELEAIGVLSSQKISREKVYVNKALYALVSG